MLYNSVLQGVCQKYIYIYSVGVVKKQNNKKHLIKKKSLSTKQMESFLK